MRINIYLTNRIILAESCEVQASSSTSSKPVAYLHVAPGFYWQWWVNGREQEDEDTVTWSSSREAAALSVLSPPGEPAEWFLSTFILFYTNTVFPPDFLHLANTPIWAKNGEFIYSFIHLTDRPADVNDQGINIIQYTVYKMWPLQMSMLRETGFSSWLRIRISTPESSLSHIYTSWAKQRLDGRIRIFTPPCIHWLLKIRMKMKISAHRAHREAKKKIHLFRICLFGSYWLWRWWGENQGFFVWRVPPPKSHWELFQAQLLLLAAAHTQMDVCLMKGF